MPRNPDRHALEFEPVASCSCKISPRIGDERRGPRESQARARGGDLPGVDARPGGSEVEMSLQGVPCQGGVGVAHRRQAAAVGGRGEQQWGLCLGARPYPERPFK